MENSLVYKLLCITGVLCNIFFLTVIYQAYMIETQVGIYTPLHLPVPKISLCFNLRELLGESKNTSDPFFDDEDAIPVVVGKKMKFLFNSTPKVNETISACSYRNFNLDTLWRINEVKECYEKFIVTKYRMQDYMCYLLNPNFTEAKNENYSFYRVAKTPNSRPREIYSVKISAPLNRVNKIAPYLHFDPLPEDDRTFNQEIYPPRDKKSVYYLSYDLHEFHRLPKPYESECHLLSKLTCFYRCRDRIYNSRGYSPTLGIVQDKPGNENISVPAYTDSREGEMLRNLSLYSKTYCTDDCKRLACDETIVKTWVSGPHDTRTSKLGLTIETSRIPHFKVQQRANLVFLDYFTQCLSVLGFCLGFSFLSFMSHSKKKEKHENEMVTRKIDLIQTKLMNLMQQLPSFRERESVSHSLATCKHRSAKVTRGKIASFLFSATVLGILSWQIIEVARNYFKYETKMKITYNTDPDRIFMSLSMCFMLHELLGGREKGEPIDENNYDDILSASDGMTNMTWSELLTKVDETRLVQACRVREEDFFNRIRLQNRTQCSQYFKINKFYWLNQMCFQLKYTKIHSPLAQSVLRFISNNPGIMYSVILDDFFANVEAIRIVLTPVPAVPHSSKQYAAVSRRSGYKNRLQILAYQVYEKITQPPPYDTNCNDGVSRMKCQAICHNDLLKQINRTSYYDILDEPVDLKILSYVDLKQKEISLKWIEYQTICHKKCLDYKRCNIMTANTFLTHTLDSKNKVEFAIDSALYPQTLAKSLPQYHLYDLYYLTFASISFWLGLSFLDFDPVQLFRKFRSKDTKKDIVMKVKSFYVALRRLSSITRTKQQLKEIKSKCYRAALTPSVSHAIVTLVCAVCCAIHAYFVVTRYMMYPSKIETRTGMDLEINYSISICINVYGNTDYGSTKDVDLINLKKSQVFNRTVAEIFDSFYQPNELIVDCGHRGLDVTDDSADVENGIFFRKIHKSKCLQTIRGTKFLQQSHMCYKYYLVKNSFPVYAINEVRGVFEISINTSVLTDRYIVTANKPDAFPAISQQWSRNLIKSDSNMVYMVSYIRFKQNTLPPPYSDSGFTYASVTRCIDSCVQGEFDKYNRTLTKLFTEPSAFRFITYADRKNGPLNKIVNQVVSSCEQSCWLNNRLVQNTQGKLTTTFNEFFTEVDDGSQSLKRKGVNLTSFLLMTTEHPVVEITYKILITPFEGIIDFGSAIAIWSGFAVYQANPFKKKITIGRILKQLIFIEAAIDAIKVHLDSRIP